MDFVLKDMEYECANLRLTYVFKKFNNCSKCLDLTPATLLKGEVINNR